MRTLALDVDGVLLDASRGGAGHWTSELERLHGISRAQLQDAFFMRCWDDILNGRRAIEDGLAEALDLIGSTVDCEDVLSCWFEADFVPVDSVVALGRRAADAGRRVVLVTNQEHRRAAFLRERLGKLLPIDNVIYSADVGYQKPENAFFERATERLGLRPDQRKQIVFVDDVLLNVETALAAGWCGVHAGEDREWLDEVERLLFEHD
jgi:putative hydrolase of the HAD superfamily